MQFRRVEKQTPLSFTKLVQWFPDTHGFKGAQFQGTNKADTHLIYHIKGSSIQVDDNMLDEFFAAHGIAICFEGTADLQNRCSFKVAYYIGAYGKKYHVPGSYNKLSSAKTALYKACFRELEKILTNAGASIG